MNYELRFATIADLASIQKLTVDGIQIWGWDIYDSLKPWAEICCSLAELEKKILSPENKCWVAVDNAGIVIGCVFLNVVERHMSGLYCSVRGQGIGSALLVKTLEFSSDAGFDHMSCEIYENNVASISLMKKYGAEKVSEDNFEGTVYERYNFPIEALNRFSSLVSA